MVKNILMEINQKIFHKDFKVYITICQHMNDLVNMFSQPLNFISKDAN